MASTGRFLSADPVIQDVSNAQALNAYSYVLNNPLSLTDPSGFFFSSLFKAIGRAIKAVARAIGRALKAIVRSAIGRAFLQILACMPPHGTVTCAPAAGALTLAAGGSLKDALIATAVSFAQMGVYDQVGKALGASGLGGAAGLVAKAAVHGVVGGAASVATGGSFESGFASGAVAGASGFLMESTPLGQVPGNAGVMLRTAVAALAGGTASVLSGGKFANGAITGAMAQLYNGEGLLGKGLIGTDAHQTLANYLQGENPGSWEANTGLAGTFLGGRPDLIFEDHELFEIKTFLGESKGVKQLQGYVDASAHNYVIGDLARIFAGTPNNELSLHSSGFLARRVTGIDILYTFRPSAHPGIITYTYTVDPSQIYRALANGPNQLPLPGPGMGGRLRFP